MRTRVIGLPVVVVVTTLWVGAQARAQVPSPTLRPLRVQSRFCGDDPGELASVASVRAATAAQCPCGGFAKHTDYVRCVRSVAKGAVKSGALRKACYLAAMRDASRSTCGRPTGAVTCCRVSVKGKTSCGVSSSFAKCRPLRGGTATIGNSEGCYDACLPSLADVTLSQAQIETAVGTALVGIADPWGRDLGVVMDRALAEIGVRAGAVPSPTPGPQASQRAEFVVSTTSDDCLNNYCWYAEYCGESNSDTYLGGKTAASGPCLNHACYNHDLSSFQSCIYGSTDPWGNPTGNPPLPDCYFSPQSVSVDGALLEACLICPSVDGLLGNYFSNADNLVCGIAAALRVRPECSTTSNLPCVADQCNSPACPGACNPATGRCGACATNGCPTLGGFRCLDASPGSIEQQCLMGATGCLAWGVGQECANGCMNNQCAPPPCVTNGCATFQATQCLNSTTQQTCGDSGAGCLSWGSDVQCDDGDPCTVGDTCSAGVCRPGTATTCNNNGIRECSEHCDGADLGDATCQSQGFQCGTLSCNLDCALDASGCANDVCSSAGSTQCLNSTSQQTCADHGSGCLTWGTDYQCGNGCVGNACATQSCGNSIREGTEQCDGTDATACPELCQSDCTCGLPTVPTILADSHGAGCTYPYSAGFGITESTCGTTRSCYIGYDEMFVPSMSGNVDTISVSLVTGSGDAGSPTDSVTLELWTYSGTVSAPLGTFLRTATVSAAAIVAAGAALYDSDPAHFTRFTFPNVYLDTGVAYYVHYFRTGQSVGNDYYSANICLSETYPDGFLVWHSFVWNGPAGGTYTRDATPFDLFFQAFGS
jgi:hypothetical protein